MTQSLERSQLTFRIPVTLEDPRDVRDAMTAARWTPLGRSLVVDGHTHMTGVIDASEGNDLIRAVEKAGGAVVQERDRRTGPAQITYAREPRPPEPVNEHVIERGPVVAYHDGRWQLVMNGEHPAISANAKPKERRATHLQDVVTNTPTEMSRVMSRPTTFGDLQRYTSELETFDRTDQTVQAAELGFDRTTRGEGHGAVETAWVDRTQINDVYDSLAAAGRNPSSPHVWRGRASVPTSSPFD
jgi:hypothetical protein